METGAWTIGALARRVGVGVETIRYYQRRGLLEVPVSATGGVRRYGEETARRVRFIKRSQQLGFTLDEVAGLLVLNDGRHCVETRVLAEGKVAQLEVKIADLEAMRTSLAKLVRACRRPGTQCGCPLIDALNREAVSAGRASPRAR